MTFIFSLLQWNGVETIWILLFLLLEIFFYSRRNSLNFQNFLLPLRLRKRFFLMMNFKRIFKIIVIIFFLGSKNFLGWKLVLLLFLIFLMIFIEIAYACIFIFLLNFSKDIFKWWSTVIDDIYLQSIKLILGFVVLWAGGSTFSKILVLVHKTSLRSVSVLPSTGRMNNFSFYDSILIRHIMTHSKNVRIPFLSNIFSNAAIRNIYSLVNSLYSLGIYYAFCHFYTLFRLG